MRRTLVVVLVLLSPVLVYAPFVVWEMTRGEPAPIPGNGRTSTVDAPWVVVIGEPGEQPDAPSHKTCVGTLVEPRLVVTAAHCVARPDPTALRVSAGRDDLRGDAGRTVRVTRTWANPEFVRGVREESYFGGAFHVEPLASADIGTLELAEALPGPTLPLARPGDVRAGMDARRYGWRLSPADEPVLWQSPTRVLGDGECARRAADSVRTLPLRWHGVSYERRSYLCTAAAPLRASDSGSPLVVHGRLAGVASFVPGADPDTPTYFTRVTSYLERPAIGRRCRAGFSVDERQGGGGRRTGGAVTDDNAAGRRAGPA